MNIIFLDLDGVIQYSINELYPESIKLLKDIINEYDAKIVLITSNVRLPGKRQYNGIVRYLELIGITNVIGKINYYLEGDFLGLRVSARTWGIIDVLARNKDINYVIIDDEYHNQYKRLGLNYIRTNTYIGLTKKDIVEPIFKKNNIREELLNYHEQSFEDKPYLRNTNNLIKVLRKVYEKRINDEL